MLVPQSKYVYTFWKVQYHSLILKQIWHTQCFLPHKIDELNKHYLYSARSNWCPDFTIAIDAIVNQFWFWLASRLLLFPTFWKFLPDFFLDIHLISSDLTKEFHLVWPDFTQFYEENGELAATEIKGWQVGCSCIQLSWSFCLILL